MLSVGLLSCLLSCFLVWRFWLARRKFRGLKTIRTKNKRRRQLAKEKKQLSKQKRRLLIGWIGCLFLAGGTIGGAFYARHYQQTNLREEDSNAIVQSYFLTDEIQENLETLTNGGSVETILPKLRELSALLVSYGNHPLSPAMSEEGTKMLVRYMSQMRQIGTNLHDANAAQLSNPEIIEGYKQDIEKMIQQRKKIFSYFRVNESALNQKK